MIAIEIPQYTYQGGAVARHVAYALDMPYGSHNQHTMFGQTKNGPAIALIGAISSISAGLTAGGLLGGILIAGGIFSGLGALTGNKTLSTIGSLAGLAGGIAGSFIGPDGGGFVNPFAEGVSFFDDTSTGVGLKNLFGGIKDAVLPTDIQGTQTAEGILQEARGSNTIESASDGATIRDVNNNITTGGSLNQRLATNTPSASGGLLSSITGDKGLMGAFSGAADGYMQNKEIEQRQPLVDAQVGNLSANASATQAQTGLLNNRYANQQFQPSAGIGVNENAQVFNEAAGTQGKYAVVLNGEVKYVSQAEYDAIRQSQSQQQQGGGLLQQGVPA